MAHRISVTILSRNNQDRIERCLSSLKGFDEIILLDNGSTDKTLERASAFPNVRIFESEFLGFGPLKNLAAHHATHDWILNIDSDEMLTSEAFQEIRQLVLHDNHIYSLPRENHYAGKVIKCCGWHPDRVLRLYNRRHTAFNDKLVHESLIVGKSSRIVDLHQPIKHFSFENASDLLDKMQNYARLFALENRGKKKSSPSKAISHAVMSFLKNFFWQRGFLYGYRGLLISVSNANGVFYKYMMLYEENRK